MGDATALQQQLHGFYRSHHGWLHAWLRRKLGCTHHAADVAHDTFTRILASRTLLGDVREPRAFLTTTASRLLIDRARRDAVERAYLAELAIAAETIAGYPSPEQTLATLQALQRIGAALAGLPRAVQDTFVLHYLDGLTQAEVAVELGVSVRMVRKHLVRCLLNCRGD